MGTPVRDVGNVPQHVTSARTRVEFDVRTRTNRSPSTARPDVHPGHRSPAPLSGLPAAPYTATVQVQSRGAVVDALFAVLLSVTSACGYVRYDAVTDGASDAGTNGPGPIPVDAALVEGDAPTAPVAFVESDATIRNPERGFFHFMELGDASAVAEAASSVSLVYAAGHLDAYLDDVDDEALPQTALDDFQATLDALRTAGLKAIIRFQYDDGEAFPQPANDATESSILAHIGALTPLLQANADVIYLVQAGFIGTWGAWGNSQHVADGEPGSDARSRVLDALLEAVPSDRRIALRFPAHKRMIYGDAASDLSSVTGGAARARVGHHNDCFASSEDDNGTYTYEPVDTLKSYLEADSAYVPVGGETCQNDPDFSGCDDAMPALARFHWSYLNRDHHPDALSRWQREGCYEEVERRLGYRLVLVSAEVPPTMRPGGSFRLSLRVRNAGFAAPTNPRPAYLVLERDDERYEVALPVDVRSWLPGEHVLSVRVRVPSNLQNAPYRLAVWLPDAAERLQDRSAYAIRFANQDTWAPATGDNTVAEITMADAAPGDAQSDVAALELLP